MLSPGQVHWAYVAFEDRPGGKVRPVLLLRIDGERAFVVEGRSRLKEQLRLLLALDGAHPDSARVRLPQSTYFYAENLRVISGGDLREYVGLLSKAETQRVINELNEI